MMKSLLCVALLALASTVVVAERDELCPTYVDALAPLQNYFIGLATADDYAALQTMCEADCLYEFQEDLLKYLGGVEGELCGVSTDDVAKVVASLSSFICLYDPDLQEEGESTEYCVESMQSSLNAAGIILVDLDLDAITVESVCTAGAGAGCCFATYLEALTAALTVACQDDLAGYVTMLPLLCSLNQMPMPDACDAFEVPTIDEPESCPATDSVNCTDVKNWNDCEDNICGLFSCTPELPTIDLSDISDADVAALGEAILNALGGAAVTSEYCFAEAYGADYDTDGEDSSSGGDSTDNSSGASGEGEDDDTFSSSAVRAGFSAAVAIGALATVRLFRF